MRRLALLLATVLVLGGGACANVAGKRGPRAGPPPIVLLSIDTFRADRMGAYGNPDGLTPNLDRFAAESILFERTYSQAILTAASHTSLFTSRYPTEQVGSKRRPEVPPEQPRLAELLALYDYRTAGFVGGADMAPALGHDAGFETYAVAAEFGSFFHTGPAALAWLDATDRSRPYFLFVHGYDTHAPYLRPTPFGYVRADAHADHLGQVAVRSATERIVDGRLYPGTDALLGVYRHHLRPRSAEGRELTLTLAGGEAGGSQPVTDEDVAFVSDVYDGAVAYADTMVGLFLAELADRGVLDEAVVVVLADHGEGLGEHGVFGHCCDAYDEESHVPLLVRLPGGEGGGRRVSGFTELIDVMPTLLELAGATPPAGIHGISLAGALRGEPFAGRDYAFTQGSETARTVTMRGPLGRLTWSGLSASNPLVPELVEAARIDGPGFVASEGLPTSEREAMRTAMVGWLRSLSPPPKTKKSRPIPEALKKSLREHGYWDVNE